MSKNYFGLLDSRNTKYQGHIQNDIFNGIGMLIDHVYTFVVSTWKQSALDGHSVIIFPNLQILFGQFRKNRPQRFLCLQLSNGEKFVFNLEKESFQKMKIAQILSNSSIAQILKDSQEDDFRVQQIFSTENEAQQIEVLSKIFKTRIQIEQIDLTSYISKHFIKESKLFQFAGKTELFFGFKNTSSLGFKLQNNSPTSIGYFNDFPRNLIFGRKVYHNYAFPSKTHIEEGHFESLGQTFQFSKDKGSSSDSIKLSEEYFKKSTTFRNRFVRLEHFSTLQRQLRTIIDKIKIETAKRFGQALLQNDYGSSKEQNDQIVTKEYTLEEMKEEIYRAAAKKQNSHRPINQTPLRSITKNNQKVSQSYDLPSSQKKYLDVSSKYQQLYVNSQRKEMFNRVSFNDQFLSKQVFKSHSAYNYQKKEDLIKKANQIIQANKEYQNCLLKQLIKQQQVQRKVLQSQEQILKASILENPSSGTRRYKRYEPLTSPFLIEPQKATLILQKDSNRRRDFNYLKKSYIDIDKENDHRMRRKSPYQVFQKEDSSRQINTFGANLSENTKSYSNLSKYKQRKRDTTSQKRQQKNYDHRFNYLKQNGEEHKIGNQKKSDNQSLHEIRLFGANSYKDKKNNTEISYNDFNRNETQGDQKSFKYQGFSVQRRQNTDTYLQKAQVYQVQERNLQRNLTSKKLKKTYHYVD